MGKGLHKVFSTVVKEISQELTALGESGSEVPHFIPEPGNFAEVTKLSDSIKKPWLVPASASGSERNTSAFPMLGVTGSRPQFRKPKSFRKGILQMFRPTRRSEFSRCWVIFSWGVLVHKN